MGLVPGLTKTQCGIPWLKCLLNGIVIYSLNHGRMIVLLTTFVVDVCLVSNTSPLVAVSGIEVGCLLGTDYIGAQSDLMPSGWTVRFGSNESATALCAILATQASSSVQHRRCTSS